jgi:hypothetical protein
MSLDKDASMLSAIKAFLYGNKEDERLSTMAEGKVLHTSEEGYTFYVKFNNGIDIKISYNYDIYNLEISNEELYANEDNRSSPLGIDRLKWYIQHISQYGI